VYIILKSFSNAGNCYLVNNLSSEIIAGNCIYYILVQNQLNSIFVFSHTLNNILFGNLHRQNKNKYRNVH
jgi:hypothetical protein